MKLTKDFSLSELDCKSGAPTPPNILTNLQRLAKNLQVLRDATGKKITVNSGYRSPAHNKAIGGAPKSQHTQGIAADIVLEDMTPAQVFAKIEELQAAGKMEIGGLKAYPTFTHYDYRGTKARW